MRRIPAAAAAALIAAVALTGCGLPHATRVTSSASATADEAASVEKVTVPDVTGMVAREARAALEAAGLEVDYSADEGVVLDQDNWTVLRETPAAGSAVDAGVTVVLAVTKTVNLQSSAPSASAAAPAMTVAQEQALQAAKSYLKNVGGFSRAALLQQLTSEYGSGFDPADAELAVSYLEQNGLVDWNAQAVQSARSYLDNVGGFSRDSLYEQLTSEYGAQFTPDQANYALDQVGL